jgi:hypothetical protein
MLLTQSHDLQGPEESLGRETLFFKLYIQLPVLNGEYFDFWVCCLSFFFFFFFFFWGPDGIVTLHCSWTMSRCNCRVPDVYPFLHRGMYLGP